MPLTLRRNNQFMSKKIDAALKHLIKALRKHAEAVGGSPVRAKRATRASDNLQKAANAYTQAVYERTKLDTPFSDVVRPELEEAILRSLAAERDAFVAEHV
jgi:hypothetical protein